MRKSNWELNKKSVWKMALSGVLLAAGICVYYYRLYGEMRLADGCFLSGLFFCCIGLFRVVRILGFFDLPIYGFKKVREIVQTKIGDKREPTMGDYADFQQNYTYERSFTPPLLTGVVLIILSMVIM